MECETGHIGRRAENSLFLSLLSRQTVTLFLFVSIMQECPKNERKPIGIPSVLEKVKMAAPAKLDYGLDYYRKL